MRTIDQVFSQKPQSTLYHYTGIGSLMGIVDSKVLWGSHIYYLNDAAEIVFASRLLRELVNERFLSATSDKKDFLRQFYSWLESFTSTPYHLFIFSLTEEGNLLSQWRSYTPHGKGVRLRVFPSVTYKSSSRAKSKNCQVPISAGRSASINVRFAQQNANIIFPGERFH